MSGGASGEDIDRPGNAALIIVWVCRSGYCTGAILLVYSGGGCSGSGSDVGGDDSGGGKLRRGSEDDKCRMLFVYLVVHSVIQTIVPVYSITCQGGQATGTETGTHGTGRGTDTRTDSMDTYTDTCTDTSMDTGTHSTDTATGGYKLLNIQPHLTLSRINHKALHTRFVHK